MQIINQSVYLTEDIKAIAVPAILDGLGEEVQFATTEAVIPRRRSPVGSLLFAMGSRATMTPEHDALFRLRWNQSERLYEKTLFLHRIIADANAPTAMEKIMLAARISGATSMLGTDLSRRVPKYVCELRRAVHFSWAADMPLRLAPSQLAENHARARA